MSALWAAFLCGVNLGKRQMKMAELKSAMEEAGFSAVKTVVASGNVRFEASGTAAEIRSTLEALIEKRFGFHSDVILRSGSELTSLLANHPFGALPASADLARHVLLFDQKLPQPPVVLESRPGDTEILRIDAREIYVAAYRQPNGRYTENVEAVLKPLGKAIGKANPSTMRNWNTMEKMLP